MAAPVVRHATAPEVEACRWCGVAPREHLQRWVPSRGWHAFAEPTRAQVLARIRARRGVL